MINTSMSMDNQNIKAIIPQVLLALIGLIAALLAFSPGIVSSDAVVQYQQGVNFHFSDWAPPIMSFIWSFTDKLLPGSFGMLLLQCLFYWGGFFLLSLAIPPSNKKLSLAVIAVGFMPFAFGTLGHIWKDVFHAVIWLFAVGLISVGWKTRSSCKFNFIASGFLLFLGSMFRFNAIFGLLPLVWLLLCRVNITAWKRWAIICLAFPMCAILLTSFFNYNILHSTKTKAFQSLIVYDLGGITHFANENYFQEQWSSTEENTLIKTCYDSRSWNNYAWGNCSFVLKKLVASGAWDDGSLMKKWVEAIYHEPVAYIQHRYQNFMVLLWQPGGILEDETAPNPYGFKYEKTSIFNVLQNVTDSLKDTFIFKPGFWLIVSLIFSIYGLLNWKSEIGSLIVSLNVSSFLYLLAYSFVGVASDFRYAYWSILATSVSVPFILLSIKNRKINRG